jgi:hypothetical protein
LIDFILFYLEKYNLVFPNRILQMGKMKRTRAKSGTFILNGQISDVFNKVMSVIT